jgi:hypothetical protein
MKQFSKGVSYYTKASVEIGFPEDDVCCHWCPLMGVESKTDRPYCKRTGEYLIVPKLDIGARCPIKFNNKEE